MKQRITNLREKAGRHKTLIQNFSYLSALQVFNMLLPLITYPYLIKVLGKETYGLVIFAQAITSYFGILVDFGFRISATKNISFYRDDREKVSEVVSSVYIIKFFLWILSLLVLLLLVSLIPSFKRESLLFIFSFGLCFNELLFPQWYFQGIEKMKYITVINLAARSLFLISIFVFVNEQSDYLLVAVLNSVGALVGGGLGLYVLFFKENIQIKKQPYSMLKSYFKDSMPLFSSNVIISVKDRFNILFIGTSLGMAEVAIYDLSIKIMNLFLQPTDIINNTIYPRVSKEANSRWVLTMIRRTFLLILILVVVIQPFLSTIIKFLGQGLTEALFFTRILLIVPLIISISQGIARNIIIARGRYQLLTKSIILTTLFYLGLVALSYTFSLHTHLVSFILITILVYFFELFVRIFLAKKHKLFNP